MAAIGKDGTIYVTSMDKKLYAINPNGTKKWEYAPTPDVYLSGPTISRGGTIYVGADYGLQAINPSGTSKWLTSLGGLHDTTESTPAIGHDGTITIV